MKKLYVMLVTTLLAFASCSEERMLDEAKGSYGAITASIEQGSTKSRLMVQPDNSLEWTEGDVIKVLISNGDSYKYKNTGNDTFVPLDQPVPDNITNEDVVGVLYEGYDDVCGGVSGNKLETALAKNVNLQEFYLSNNSLDKIMELDNSFHETMYRITNKMQCFYMVKLMNIHYDRFRELRLHSSNPQSIINEHKEILTAFKAKDCAKVKELILKHLNRLYIDEKAIRQKYPDYFA